MDRLRRTCRRLAVALWLAALVLPATAVEPVGRAEIVAALHGGDIAALDARLNALQAAYEADPAAETALETSFGWFRSLQPAVAGGEALDRWVAQHPQSYAARLARGTYFIARGMEARGEKWSKDTSREQFDEMERWFERGRAELESSLRLAARPLLSRMELMSAAMRSGWRDDLEAHYAAAESFAPQSVALRLLYMQSRQPRWGGSHEAMESYVRASAAPLGPGPALDRLKSMIPADKAREMLERDAARAEELLGEAIALADRARYRCHRAWARWKLDRLDEAAQDLVAAARLGHNVSYCHDTAASLARHGARAPALHEALEAFLQEAPDHAAMLNQRGWIRQQRGDLAGAYADYRRAAEQGDAWAETMTGKFLFSGTGGIAADREQALEWLRRAAGKGERNAQLSLVQALEAMGRHDEAAREKARFAADAGGAKAAPGSGERRGDQSVSLVNRLIAAGAVILLVALFLALRAGRK